MRKQIAFMMAPTLLAVALGVHLVWKAQRASASGNHELVGSVTSDPESGTLRLVVTVRTAEPADNDMELAVTDGSGALRQYCKYRDTCQFRPDKGSIEGASFEFAIKVDPGEDLTAVATFYDASGAQSDQLTEIFHP